jgi:DNA-binding NarL/FixJ family response regulator
MTCELLAAVLSRTSQLQVVGWQVDSDAALRTVAQTKTDVALISSDLQDGPRKGLALTSELRLKHPDVRSVLLLDRADRQETIEAFRAGARGVLSRHRGLAALPKCISRVSEGQVWASSKELEYLLDTFVQPAPSRALTESCCKLLTEREKTIVQLVAEGLSNREIASQLELSPHTVKNYVFRVFDKIGVNSRVELVLCALSSTMPGLTNSPRDDRAHAVAVDVRQRRDTMTNA